MVEIKFDKGHAEAYIRDKAIEALDKNKNAVLVMKPIMGFSFYMLLCGVGVVCLSLFICGFARALLGGDFFATETSRIVFTAILVFIWELVALGICKSLYLSAIQSYEKYLKERNAPLETLMQYCDDTHDLWHGECGYGRYLELKRMYEKYCIQVELCKMNIVRSNEKGKMVTVEHVVEDGYVETFIFAVDEVRRNCKVAFDVIEWIDGRVVYTEKIEVAQERSV